MLLDQSVKRRKTMPLIETIQPENATGKVKEQYDRIKEVRGAVANSQILFSASPELLKQQVDYIEYYMNHKSLSQELLACTRMLVSERNHCAFCIGFNSGMLINKFGWSEAQIAAAKENPSNANLSEKEKTMLLFTLKGVSAPHTVDQNDIDALYAVGYNDKDILDALNHGARMSAIDAIFDALKVEM